ncbi:hypothetical protein OESDEN_03129 [Oesophagostomum dentatum]|uniref:Uncharacterized protein n=1 Tax=Oesophagostomum dentatum TaxID=61180 RepID=A0A0B1TLB4_OESDE|nr:hypothetical protein OESDEN_03129 [Oesophagostomum dentatum]
MRTTRTTRTTRRGNESESDSEYVSTVETTDALSIGSSIPTTESQLPPPIQDMLYQQESTSASRSGVSTSVVDTHQYQADSQTTVTHTMITFTDGDTTGSTVPTGSTDFSGTTSASKQESAVKRRPKMVVPNESVPVMTPLLLRVNPVQRAASARMAGTYISTPLQKVRHWKADKSYSARYRTVISAETPIQCTFTMAAFLAHSASIQHIMNTPVLSVSAFCLPPKQRVEKHQIKRKTFSAHLMLPPQGPLHAEVLRPLWETITFTIAYGKHVAIEYRIPKINPIKALLIKCTKQKVKEVDSRTLHRKVDQQKVEIWKAAQPHQIILTTVEKSDPQMVKRVRLEQNPLFDRFPPSCNIAEVDLYTTEEIINKTKDKDAKPEKHTYVDHQLIQKCENTVHVESRRRRIN